MFDIFRIFTLKQQKFSQSDPVLIRPKLASFLIQSDPVLIRAHLCHRPLITPVNPIELVNTKPVKRWNFRKANWEKFSNFLESGIDSQGPDKAGRGVAMPWGSTFREGGTFGEKKE